MVLLGGSPPLFSKIKDPHLITPMLMRHKKREMKTPQIKRHKISILKAKGHKFLGFRERVDQKSKKGQKNQKSRSQSEKRNNRVEKSRWKKV